MKKILFTLTLVVSCLTLFGQQEHIRCGNDIYHDALRSEFPDFERNTNEIFEAAATFANSPQARSSNGVVYTIPVVVHVVYKNATENLSTTQVQSQIDVLNEDFRMTNSDANQVPNLFASLAADVEFEFCLAQVDPSGNATDGITRTQTNVNSFSVTSDNVKSSSTGGKDPWPASDYLNIWVCEITGGILGYATPPGTAASRDGVVVGYQFFGTSGTATYPYNEGRTGTHEVGHYFGLRHIWGDGGCGVDDQISDTPLQGQQYGGCPSFPQTTCGSSDMFMNFMDYVDDRCMFMFTTGQSQLMQYVMQNFRSGLITSSQTACGGVNPGACNNITGNDITMGFEDNETFAGWNIENVNNDDKTWEILAPSSGVTDWGPRTGNKSMAYLWSSTEIANDWFFTPCIEIEPGKEYEISFWYATATDGNAYPERLRVGYSTSQSASGAQTLSDLGTITQPFNANAANNGYEEHTINITSADVGNATEIYLGFHCYSAADQYALLIDDILIKDLGGNGSACNSVLSNDITMGFESGENAAAWTIENTNNDDRTWEVSTTDNPEWGPHGGSGYIRYQWSTTENANDYIFSPCVEVLAGREYEFSFWYATANDDNNTYPEKLRVVYGTSPSSSSVQLLDDLGTISQPYNPNATDNGYEEAVYTFTNTGTDSEVYFGFHCYSDADQYMLQIDDIQISDITTISNEDVIEDSYINIYPNPVANNLVIEFDFETMQKDVQIEVVDVMGRSIHSERLSNAQQQNVQINMMNQPNGVYFVNIQADGKLTTRKVVVSH